jgi:hypothetical protein
VRCGAARAMVGWDRWGRQCGRVFVSRILSPRGGKTSSSTIIPLTGPHGPGPRRSEVRLTRSHSQAESPPSESRPGGPFPLFCLAPREVFRAPAFSGRAVGSYPAFSPLPAALPLLTTPAGGLFSVTLSVRVSFRPSLPAFITRRAAFRCPDFPLSRACDSAPQRSFRTRPRVRPTARRCPTLAPFPVKITSPRVLAVRDVVRCAPSLGGRSSSGWDHTRCRWRDRGSAFPVGPLPALVGAGRMGGLSHSRAGGCMG